MTARKTTKSTCTKPQKKKPSWSDVKPAIANFERPALIGLISDLYAYSTANKNFLHGRFSLGNDPLKPYKQIIDNALYPDVMSNDPIEIATAKKAISDYGKAVGDPKGLLELMLFFVECGTRFTLDYGDIDEHFYASLEKMYEKAIKLLLTLDEATIDDYCDRFEELVTSTRNIGWGFHDTLGDIFYEAFPEE